MKIKRALAIENQGKNFLYSLFSTAKRSGMESKEINQKVIDFRSIFPKDVPRWVTGYWNGVRAVLSDDLYKNHLEFCYWVEGVKYSVRRDSDMYYAKHDINPSQLFDCPNGYYWIKTGKLYFGE